MRAYAFRTTAPGLLALALLGCLPVARIYPASPAINGRYLRTDGTPAVGVPLALGVGYGNSLCARTTRSTVTDSAGRFWFPATRDTARWLVVLPIDPPAREYAVCAVRGTARVPLYRANVYQTSRGRAAADTLVCVEGADGAGPGVCTSD